jgi:hypothetical protein
VENILFKVCHCFICLPSSHRVARFTVIICRRTRIPLSSEICFPCQQA